MKRKVLIFGSIILIASLAIGSELMSFYKSKFSGLNSSVNVRLLQDDEAYDISNFSLDEIGSIKERELYGQYNSISGALGSNSITGLFKHYTTTSKYFFACAGTKIGLGSGGAFTDITPTNSSVVAGSYYSGISFNNRFYLFNPSDEMFTYTGTGSFHKLGNTSAIPSSNCAYSAVHKSRVWAARSDTLPYRLYWSSLNTAENWTATGGYADLPDINQEIKGIISWGGYLYIFTETNIYVLLGSTPNDFSLRKTNSMVGCIAPRSIKITDIGICFLSRSGVYAFDGNNSNKISIKIDGTINSISRTLIQNSCAIYDGKKYWLSYTPSGSSYNSRVIIYDIYLKDWTIYQGDACNISYFERAYGGTDRGELYGGSSTTNGIVYQLQAAIGIESITHSTKLDFDNGVTFNTVVTNTPTVELLNGIDSYTKLLIHFNGSNAQTTYTTEDSSKRTVTFNADAKLNTAQKKYGSSSLILDGALDYVSVPSSDDWDLGTGAFTIDGWINIAVRSNFDFVIRYLNAGNFWDFFFNNGANTLTFQDVSGFIFSCSFNPTAGLWYHIALVRIDDDNSADSWRIFINGVSQTLTLTGGAWNNAIGNYLGSLRFGSNVGGAYLNGYYDEVRVSKGIARWTENFTPQSVEYDTYTSGTLTSQNIQINANGQSSLGVITWIDSLPSNTKVTFQTRTGITNDTVYFNSWQYWSSANTVTLNTVTDGTIQFQSSTNDGSFTLFKPYNPQKRDVLYYEDEDVSSANCVTLNTVGTVSKGKYIEAFIPTTNLSTYDWLGGWYKSDTTGNSIEFYFGEGVSSSNYVTFNTVASNSTVDGWYKWYWYIGGISTANRDSVNYIKYRYTGDATGSITIGEVNAYNFYEKNDTMTSTPNDFIQYRAIFGSNDANYIPKLTSVTLAYTPALLISESSLSSYYYTKWFDFKTPQLNKNFDSIIIEANASTSSSVTLYCDYDIDFGLKTGTFSFPITTTANTVRLFKNFPSSISGKAMRLKIYNNDKDAQVTVKGLEVRYRTESVTPD